LITAATAHPLAGDRAGKAGGPRSLGGCLMPARGRSGTLSGMIVALVDLSWGGAVLRPVTWRERIGARLRGAALDEALVAGVPPEAEVALTLHARRLIAPGTRRRIARTLVGMVDATGGRAAPPSRPHGLQVAHAAPELLALAQRLERRDAVDARGVALARELLRDGLGALYADRGGSRLAEAAREATEALDPV
jgi:hypothetical protein